MSLGSISRSTYKKIVIERVARVLSMDHKTVLECLREGIENIFQKYQRTLYKKIAINRLARTLSTNQEKVLNMTLGRYTVRFAKTGRRTSRTITISKV